MRLLPLLLLCLSVCVAKSEDMPDKAQEVDRLLVHLGYSDSLPRMLGSIQRTMQKTYASLNLPPEAWAELAKELSYEEARAMSAKLYMDRLTIEEIKAANAFYESDVGRSYAKKVAEIGEQEFTEARDWAQNKTELVLRKYTNKGNVTH